MAEDLGSSALFIECPSWRAQVKIFNAEYNDPLKISKKKISFTNKEIASLFDCEPFRVKNQVSKIIAESKGLIKPIGHPSDLNQDIIGKLKEFAKNSEFHRTVFEVKLFLSNILGKTPDHKVVDKALKKIGYRKADAKPMESRRYFLDLLGLYHFFQIIEQYFDENDIPSSFVFNLDEEGHSAQADSKTIPVIVPESYDKEVTYPINKEEKRITFLGCISGSGDYLKPLIITPRKTVPMNLLATNVVQKIKLSQSDSGFITEKLFMEWFDNVFLTHIRNLRREFHDDGPAVLFLDGATAHAYDRLTEKCAENNIKVFLFPAHSSHLVQPLDLVVFHVHKSYIRRDNALDALDRKFTERILKLFSTWQSAATVMNINAAWESMGVTFIPCENGATSMKIRMKNNKRIQKAIVAARMTNPETEIPELIDANEDRYHNLEALYKSRLSIEAFNQLNGIIVNTELKGIFRKHKMSILGTEDAQTTRIPIQEETQSYFRAANEFVNSTPNPLLDPIPDEPGEDYSDDSVPHPVIPPAFLPDPSIVQIDDDAIDLESIDPKLLKVPTREVDETERMIEKLAKAIKHPLLFQGPICEEGHLVEKGAALKGGQYKVIQMIKYTKYSELWMADDISNVRKVAIKVMRMKQGIDPKLKDEMLKRFGEGFPKLQHSFPNIVQCYDYFIIDDDKFAIVMNYCEFNLRDFLFQRGRIHTNKATEFLKQIVQGLLQLSVPYAINLCPEHIYGNGDILIIKNFRLTELIKSCDPLLPFDPFSNGFYKAPELFQLAKSFMISSAAQTYAVGIIFNEMLTGARPVESISDMMPMQIPHNANEFINFCLKDERPELSELITTSYWLQLFK